MCFGLHQDLSVKQGQVSHLDHNPSNSDLDNLAFLCLPHHDEYDTLRSQSKGLKLNEVKQYRKQLYDEINARRMSAWPLHLDVPELNFCTTILPSGDLPGKGVQLTDKDASDMNDPPALYLTVYFKTSRYFSDDDVSMDERWLFLQADMRPALNLRTQVRAFDTNDVTKLMEILRNRGDSALLQGIRSLSPEHPLADFLYVWREKGEIRVMLSTFTPTSAGISIHARLSRAAASSLASHLEGMGFTKSLSS